MFSRKTPVDPFIQLRQLYKQPEAERVDGWKDIILNINQFPAAWANHIAHLLLVKKTDLLFFNFLIAHGANTEILRPYQAALIKKSAQCNDFLLLKWLIECCNFRIGRPRTQKLSTLEEHPLGQVLTHVDTKVRDYLLQQISDRTRSCDSPLIIAARYGYDDLFHYLLDEKQHDPNEKNTDDETPLMYAVQNNSKSMVMKLLEHNVDLSVRSTQHLTVFHMVISVANIPLLMQLLSHFNRNPNSHTLNTIHGDHGTNLLHYLIEKVNDFKLAKLLLTCLFKYMNKDVRNQKGLNLAVFACLQGKTDLAEWLVNEHKIDLNATDNQGMNVMHLCIMYGCTVGFEWLMSQSFDLEARTSDGNTALLSEAAAGGDEFLEKLLLRSNLSVTNHTGMGIGHYLALNDRSLKIKRLLENKTLILSTKDHHQYTLLDVAFDRENTETLHVIFEYLHKGKKRSSESLKSLVNPKNFESLLSFFCMNAHKKDYQYVEQGQPPLHWACLERNRSLIQNIQQKFNLDVNQFNQHGESPLALMVNMQSFEQAQWFFELFKAKLTNLDTRGSNMLHLACEQGHIQLAEWCLTKKPSLLQNMRSFDHKDALDIAIQQQNQALTKFIWALLIKKSSEADQIKIRGPEVCTYLITHQIYQPTAPSSPIPPAPSRLPVARDLETSSHTTEAPEQAVVSMSLPAIDRHWMLENIIANNLTDLKKLKHRPDLEDFFAQEANTLMSQALLSGHNRITYQLLRIPGIYQNLTDHTLLLTTKAIQTRAPQILRALLKCQHIRSIAHHNNNELLHLAIELGEESAVLPLLACEEVRANAHVNNNSACFIATKNPSILMYLLELENVRAQLLMDTEYTLLFQMVSIGDLDNLLTAIHIDGMKSCLSDEALIKLYTLAQANEHAEIMTVFLEFPCVQKHLGLCEPIQNTYIMMPEYYYSAPVFPIYYVIPIYQGPWIYAPLEDIPVMQTPIFTTQSTRRDDFYSIFHDAVEKQNYDLVQHLMTDRFIKRRAMSFYHHMCWVAINNHDLYMLTLLFSCNAIEQQLVNKHQILCWAIQYSDHAIVSFLLNEPQVGTQLSERNLYALRLAIQKGDLLIVNQLLAIDSVRQQASILNNYAFRKALKAGIPEIIYGLLEIPAVFQQAITAPTKSHSYIAHFIENKLQSTPLLDYTYEQMILYRLIFRSCIQKNQKHWNAALVRWLSEVSIFRNSAHISIDVFGQPNEFLQLAQIHKNVDIARTLLSIEQVKEIAVTHGFYRDKNPGLHLSEYIDDHKPMPLSVKAEEKGRFFQRSTASDAAASKCQKLTKSCC